jgi:outer membrane immunogenic protein
VKWLATARGRFGHATDVYLLYVTGGAAWGQVNETDTAQLDPIPVQTASFSRTRTGWTAGGGIEVRLFGNLTGKLEFLYVDLGRTTNTFAFPGIVGTHSFTTVSTIRDNIVRAGLNYKFDWGPGFVRY